MRNTAAIDSPGVYVTALTIVRWKPSTRSRSLSGISSFASLTRIVARSDDSARYARREHVSPFQSARTISAGTATEHSTP